MVRLVRAQTADGGTVIEFLDDVMQDRNEGFKCHHRIAAAKELIVHIVRDEQPSHTPSPLTGEGWGEGGSPDLPAHTTVVPEKSVTHPRPRQAGPEPVLSTVEEPALSLPKGPADSSPVVPAKEPAEGPQTFTAQRPRRRQTRKQRRQDGAARATALGKHPTSERNKEEKQDKPAPADLTPAERRIKERLQQHWREPDPYGAPIDSTHPGRSPPW